MSRHAYADPDIRDFIARTLLAAYPDKPDSIAEALTQLGECLRLKPDDLVRELRVDLELPLAEATEDLEKLLRHLEPFGVGNPGPLFVARDVRLASNATKIGANGVKFAVEAPQGTIEAVGWGLSERSGELRAGATVDIAYKLERNEFRGRSTLQLGLVDFR